MSILDFLFRRGNPTNAWRRSEGLALTAALDVPSLHGVSLGERLDRLSFLGRNDTSQCGALCYYDLGIGIDCADDGTFSGYWIAVDDEENQFKPYAGTITWRGRPLEARELTCDDLPDVFGDWYWLDTDEEECIAFFEYPGYEIQVELTLSGRVKFFVVTQCPLMADPEGRAGYKVTKPWPPQYGTQVFDR